MSATLYGMGSFYAAYCIDESKIQNLYLIFFYIIYVISPILDLICSNGYVQGAKEQASEAMSRVGRKESPGESTTWNWYALAFIILQYMA